MGPEPACMGTSSSSGGSGGRRKTSDWDDNPFSLLPFIPIGPILIINPGWAVKQLEKDD
jgi:hypothetical protein